MISQMNVLEAEGSRPRLLENSIAIACPLCLFGGCFLYSLVYICVFCKHCLLLRLCFLCWKRRMTRLKRIYRPAKIYDAASWKKKFLKPFMKACNPVVEKGLYYVFTVFFKNTNILQEWLGKNPCFQHRM